MLSAKELVKAVKETKAEEVKEEKTCYKLLGWDGKYHDPEVETKVTSLLHPLTHPRVSIKSSLSEAVWDEDSHQVVIIKNCGRQELGPLLPEEALFLMENNSLYLTRKGVPLSLQTAYTHLISDKTGLTQGKILQLEIEVLNKFLYIRNVSCLF